MTGHAGCSVSTVAGPEGRRRPARARPTGTAVAVIGDGAFPSGIVFEALNNAGGLEQERCWSSSTTTRCRSARASAAWPTTSTGPDDRRSTRARSKRRPQAPASRSRWSATRPSSCSSSSRTALKALLHGGMLFEELGFRYFGPIDGHDLPTLRKYLRDGQGRRRARSCCTSSPRRGTASRRPSEDPVTFHTPPPFEQVGPDGRSCRSRSGGAQGVHRRRQRRDLRGDAGRPEGRRASPPPCARATSSRRSATTSPTASSTSASARATPSPSPPGMAKAGLRPIVDIYSTFLQRSFDQIFQEVALQNLPVVVLPRPRRPDRARRPDAPRRASTSPYMRLFPNMVVMAPGDEQDVAPMLDFALEHDGPSSIRYPKANLETVERERRSRSSWARPRSSSGATDGMLRRLRHAARRPASRRPSGSAQRRPATSASSTPASSSRSTRRRSLQGGRGAAASSSRSRKARWRAASARPCWKRPTTPACRRAPRPPARHPRPLHRARRARRAARRPRPRRRRPHRRRPWSWPGPSACRPS